MAKVSVIIPVYNTEKYLRQCLDSVTNQTLQDIEIICVNDGSTDRSQDILEEYAQKDSRILLINKENTNAGNSRNIGLEKARGEFVYFPDSDDWLELNAFEKLYKKATETNADIIVFYNKLKDDSNNTIQPCPWTGAFGLTQDFDVFNKTNFPEIFYNFCNIPAWSKLYRLSFIKQNNLAFQEITTCNDVYFNIMSLTLAEKITKLPEELYTHRVGHLCLTKDRYKHIDCIMKAFSKTKESLEKNNYFNLMKNAFYINFLQMFNYELSLICDKKIKKKWFKIIADSLPCEYKKLLKKGRPLKIIRILKKLLRISGICRIFKER
ncbi:glycosyltransferase family 2 protein [bacterium]|nr:glycosyltransferase family 2 protein [bacterium]